MPTGENRVGSKWSGERERERKEQQINGVRDGTLGRNRNGVG